MDILRNNEEKVFCPYNESHYVQKNRLEMHLIKCRKNHTGPKEMVRCDFNSAHIVPKIELQYHHNECPDRRNVELHVFSEEGVAPSIKQPLPAIPVPVDSSWDDDEVPSYNPQKYCEENTVLRRVDGEPASARRDFQINERQRFNNISNIKATCGKPSSQQSSAPLPKPVQKQRTDLPEAPVFSVRNIENVPSDISKMMKKLDQVPKAAVIAKPRNK